MKLSRLILLIHIFLMIACDEGVNDSLKSGPEIFDSGISVERPIKGGNEPNQDMLVQDMLMQDMLMQDLGMLDAQLSDMSIEDMQVPDMQVPDMQVPDMQVPDMQVPDMQVPDMQVPDMQVPDMQTPDMQTPDMMIDPNEDNDGDEADNSEDNCLNIYNEDQEDSDNDGIGDVCDNCPFNPNPSQIDSNGNGVGDDCEWTGEGIEVILTHNGDVLDNDVFLQITPPFVSRFSSDVCSDEHTSPTCISDSNADTVQKLQYLPIEHSSSIVSVKLTRELRPTSIINVQVSCGNSVSHHTLTDNDLNVRDSVWDILQIAWPSCAERIIDTHQRINCDGDDNCTCSSCMESPCVHGTCPEQVSCDPFSGACANDCGGNTCADNEICDQRTQSCQAATTTCQVCSTIGQIDCPANYECLEYMNANATGICLKSCDTDIDCDVGACERTQTGLFSSAKLCTNPLSLCE